MRLRTALALLLGLAFAGCSDPSPVDDVFEGELSDDDETVGQDQSKYDDYRFEAGENWTITVDMESSEVDSYLWLIGPNEDGDMVSLAQDDDSGEGLNARLSQETGDRPGTYIVRANAGSGDRGAYRVHVVASPAGGQ
ncbi:MAG: hypothetical protein AB8I08_18445 [Sandaracinaceae bacterium]